MLRKGRAMTQPIRVRASLVLAAAIATVLSLGAVLRVYAMPVEARTTESWLSYRSSVSFAYTAMVKPGKFYSDKQLHPEQLMRIKLPVEPVQYRRVLISKFVDAIEVQVPYHFKADRPAEVTGQVGIDGLMVMPGIWQKPYPLVDYKAVSSPQGEIDGVATFVVPITNMLADMEANRTEYGITLEPQEIHIRPVFDVQVKGLRQPVQVQNSPDFVISVRSGTVEVDEPRDAVLQKTLDQTTVVPVTISLFGQPVRVATLRQISLIATGVFLALAAIMLFLRRSKPNDRKLLHRLGPNLISVRSFELPGGTAIAEVRSMKELLQLHVQTERPVIKVGAACYLLDGTTCYRYTGNGNEIDDD